jgi:hypothetical protein
MNTEGQTECHQFRKKFEETSVVLHVREFGGGIVREKGRVKAKNDFTVPVLKKLIPRGAIVPKRYEHENSQDAEETLRSPFVQRVASHDVRPQAARG